MTLLALAQQAREAGDLDAQRHYATLLAAQRGAAYYHASDRWHQKKLEWEVDRVEREMLRRVVSEAGR